MNDFMDCFANDHEVPCLRYIEEFREVDWFDDLLFTHHN